MAGGVLVLVSSSFPNAADGTEAAGSFVADLVEGLSRRIPVRVVAPGLADEVQHVNANLQIYRFSAPEQPLSTLSLFSVVDLLRILKVLRAGGKATRAAVSAGGTVHILALWALPCGYWAKSAGVRFSVPYSVWTLGSDIWSLGKIPVVRRILAGVLRNARRCYSDGYRLRDDTQRIAGRDVMFLPSTRNIALAGDKALSRVPPYRLTFIGRWHENKGPDLLMRALSLLDDDTWRRISAVEILGGGTLRPLLESESANLVANRRPVVLVAFVDKSAAQMALQRTDYVLIPSRIESIPVIFSDAMKLRCPVIASPVGDLPALVAEGPVGVVAAAVSAAAYAEAIRAAVHAAPDDFGAAIDLMAAQFSLEGFLVPKLIAELDLEGNP